MSLKIALFKIIPISPRAQWVKSLLIRPRGNHPRATKLDITLQQCGFIMNLSTRNKLQKNLIKIQKFSCKKIHLKMLSANCPPFYSGLNVSTLAYLCFHRTHRILHMRPCGHFDNVIEVVSVDVVFIHKGYDVRYTFRLLLGQRWRQFTSHLWKVIHGQRFFVSWDAEITRLWSLHINALVLDYRNSSAFTLQLPVLDLAIDIPDQLNPWH